MIVQLDSKTRIVGTERAWALQRPRIREGTEVWVPYKWFNSFGSALEKAVHRDIRIHPANGLSEAIEAVSTIVQRYTELIPSEYRLTK
ncbi:protein of unknown function [uncultured Woeseiaceae bacterium]|uniref:Uncharacterized protein n=1 Tax=uncultured Woeseiaceae bacterium TaxID=1983305 RepID=A0A7D9H5F0_9GAMM|nr:protein of unknown function [uncultured Woeseiaceae bacterium]